VRIKVSCDQGGRVVNVAPEFEDCKRIAQSRGIPLKEVYREIPSVKGFEPEGP